LSRNPPFGAGRDCAENRSFFLTSKFPDNYPMNSNDPRPPKKWKMFLISWLFVYPVINLMFAVVFPLVQDLHQLLKTLIFTAILVPLMGIFIPKLHQKFWGWIVK
jgi:antibiotic biosynthesis monooxygenase (ABM) superfamily enzyme